MTLGKKKCLEVSLLLVISVGSAPFPTIQRHSCTHNVKYYQTEHQALVSIAHAYLFPVSIGSKGIPLRSAQAFRGFKYVQAPQTCVQGQVILAIRFY